MFRRRREGAVACTFEPLEDRFLLSTDTIEPNSTPALIANRPSDSNDGACTNTHCSLREAVVAANANPGTDIITLATKLYSLHIKGVDEDAAATGDLDITDDLKIIGAGPEQTTIDAGRIDRVLHIHEGVTVTIEGISIIKGQADHGAGIYNEGHLTLTDSQIADNRTHDGADAGAADGNLHGGDGGGIFNDGTLTLNNTTVFNNSTGKGGENGGNGGRGAGIFNRSWARLNGSTVKDNETGAGRTGLGGPGGNGGDGGGIFNLGAFILSETTGMRTKPASGAVAPTRRIPTAATEDVAVMAAASTTLAHSR